MAWEWFRRKWKLTAAKVVLRGEVGELREQGKEGGGGGGEADVQTVYRRGRGARDAERE